MGFIGKIERVSHEGGLLASFTGGSPALNTVMMLTSDSSYVGKVDGVLGTVDEPLIHIAHLDNKVNPESLIDQEIIIRPKKEKSKQSDDRQNRRNNDSGSYQRSERDSFGDRKKFEKRNDSFGQRSNQRNDRRGRNDDNQRNDRYQRRNDGQGERRGHRNNSTFTHNDWDCPECSNSNFSFRENCNKCDAPRPGGGGQSKPRNNGQRDRRNQQNNTYNDWDCPKCSNSNFSFRENCNKCDAPRPGSSGNSRQRSDSRRHGSNDRGRGGPRRDNGGRGGQRSNDRGRGGSRGNDRGQGGQRSNQRGGKPNSQYRKARGKGPNHAHNRPPNEIGFRRARNDDD